jgi:hypothetical protein
MSGSLTLGAGAAYVGTHGAWTGEQNKIQWHSSHLYFQNRGGGNFFFRRSDGTNILDVDNSGNLIMTGGIYPSGQTSYYLYQANSGLWTNGNFGASGDLYLGTRSTWLSSWLNQSVQTGASPTFANLTSNGYVGNSSAQSRDKIRVWDSSQYAIGMKSGYDYGHLGNDEYAMSFQMNDNSGRGFWWGDTGHNDDQGAASLTTDGRMVIAKSLSIGEGESMVTPSSAPLYVKGSTDGAEVLAVDGVNGRLFTVTDSVLDTIYSVNTIAGLPIIEVLANSTVKIGKYGSNSITISDSKIAINSDSVDAKFPFYVGDRSTSSSRYNLTNPGMGFNLADGYAQLQLYGTSGAYIDFVNSATDYQGRIMWNGSAFSIIGNMSWGGATLSGAVWNGTAISDSYISSASNWNTAYNKRPTGVAFSGSSTKTLTLTLGDGSTLTAAFNDIDTDTNSDGQTLSINGSTLTISGGNSVTIPSGGMSQATADGRYTRNLGYQVNVGNLNDLDGQYTVNLDGYGPINGYGGPDAAYNASLWGIGNRTRGAQIYIPYAYDNLYFRRGADDWSGWFRALNTSADPYPSNMNQYVRTSDAVTFTNVYNYGWFRNYNANEGVYNQATGTHFYSSNGSGWTVTGSGGIVELVFRSNHQSTIRGYVYADTSNNIGFLANDGNWGLRVDSSKNVQVYGYLTVGNSTSSDIYMTDTDETTRRIHANSGRIGFLTSSNGWGAYCDNSGNWYAANFSGSSSGTNTGDQTNISGLAGSETLSTVTGRGASTASQTSFTKTDDHAISVGTIRGRAVGSQSGEFIQLYERVNIGGPNGWGAANTAAPSYGLSVYGGANIGYGNSASLFAYAYRGNSNVAGTGEASHHPAGIYSTGTNWLYGTVYLNGNDMYDINGIRAYYYYDRSDTGYYIRPSGISRVYGLAIRGDNSSTDTSNQIFFWGEGNSTTSAIGFKANGGNFPNPTGFGDGYNTYLTMDSDGRGWVFRRGVGGTNFSSAYTSGWILNNGVWQANASMRAPIFYDSADTSYYVDPNSSSRVYHIHADYLSIGQGINTSYRVITNGDYYANGGGNYWAEGRFKQYRGSGTWHDVIDSGNIGSQSVNYASSAGNADTVDSLHASSFVRNDTYSQYLRAYYQYGNYLTTERPVDFVDQGLAGGGLRVDFMNNGGGGSWNHVITFSGYNAYNMYQLGGYYDGGSTTDLYVRSEANHGRTSWTSWRRLLHSSNYTDYTISKNNWDGNLYLHTDGRIYGTIFYDSNDSAYYVDPNGTSNLYKFGEGTLNRNSLNSRQINSPWATRANQGTLYQTGAMGWGNTDLNTVGSYWGSGFIDVWGSPANGPGASGHYVGMQAFHYNNSDGARFHGWQMVCAQEANNRWFWRSAWDTPRSWVEMIHSGNIGSQSVNYASSAGSVAWDSVTSKPGIYLHNTWHGNTYIGTGGDIYCTILYDSNNSGYYLDPNGTSRLNRTNYDYVYSYNWVYAEGDIIAFYSDERLKTRVGAIENALDKIKQLTGFYYVNNDLAKSFGYKDEKLQVGLSAQEVQSVLPEVVTLAPFDTEFDENNQAIGSKSGESYLTVSYDKLVPLLIESIKEQQLQIEELKSEVKKLKGE